MYTYFPNNLYIFIANNLLNLTSYYVCSLLPFVLEEVFLFLLYKKNHEGITEYYESLGAAVPEEDISPLQGWN